MSSKHSYSFISGSRWASPISTCAVLMQAGVIVTVGLSSPAAAEPASEPAAESKVVAEDGAAEKEGSSSSDAEAEDGAADDAASDDAAADDAAADDAASDAGASDDATEVASEESQQEVAAEEAPEQLQEASTPTDEEGWMNLEASSARLEEKPPEPKPYFRTMLLIEGAARYGAVTIAPPGTTLEEEDPDAFESRVGNFGGQVTLGVMPGGSAFTMAGRLRAGSYVSADFTRGNVAAEMLFGANFGRNARGSEFTYVLGGFGVEFLPGENQDILTLNVGAATVVKGVSFGGGILLGANDEIAIGTIGMQIGWGQLF